MRGQINGRLGMTKIYTASAPLMSTIRLQLRPLCLCNILNTSNDHDAWKLTICSNEAAMHDNSKKLRISMRHPDDEAREYTKTCTHAHASDARSKLRTLLTRHGQDKWSLTELSHRPSLAAQRKCYRTRIWTKGEGKEMVHLNGMIGLAPY